MRAQGRIIGLFLASFLLSSCVGEIWTGASLIYDRHNVYKKLDDYKLLAAANQAIYQNKLLKRNDVSVELAAFNGDILLVGSVPTVALREEINARVARISGYRRLFNQLSILPKPANAIQDSWITGDIRSRMIANSEIDPSKFKVVTYNQIVYLMGDVVPAQASLVIAIARQSRGVTRVVKLFKYYHLSDKMA